MGPYEVPEFKMPLPQLYSAGEDYVEKIGETVRSLRLQLKPDEGFVCEYGSEQEFDRLDAYARLRA